MNDETRNVHMCLMLRQHLRSKGFDPRDWTDEQLLEVINRSFHLSYETRKVVKKRAA